MNEQDAIVREPAGRGSEALSERTVHRLAVMGYYEAPTCSLAAADSGLRFTNTLTAALMWIGALWMDPLLPWSLAAFGFLATLMPRHPFDLLHGMVVRRGAGRPGMPPSSTARRFSLAFASTWLVLVGLAFFLGHRRIGFGLAVFQAAAATLAATTRICLPSLIYRLVFGWPERGARRAA